MNSALKNKLGFPAVSGFSMGSIVEDFRTLDPKDPGLWPLAPKVLVIVCVFAAAIACAWLFGWSSQWSELEAAQTEEAGLKEDWLKKKQQAINLEAYRKQLEEIKLTFGEQLKQLPNASEVETLLVDINQAGLGHGLQFDLFKPQSEVRKEFYAELPITIKVSGTYHELGEFAGDIAKLSRIVTLNDIEINPVKDDTLAMTAVAKTFRYLDTEEVAQQKKTQSSGKK